MNNKEDMTSITDKLYRKKLFEENKDLYKKVRADFIYGISANFRQRRKNSKDEMKELEEETLQILEEID